MITKLLYKLKQSEEIDFNGLFFYAIDLSKKNLNILLFNQIIKFICLIKGLKLGKNIIFNGNPVIHRYPNSTIRFGNNCKFNSSKNSIFIGLQQPCAFVTTEENAEIVFGNNSGATGLKIQASCKIVIGNNVLIGSSCMILDNDSHHSDPTKREKGNIPSRPINIEDNVFIGFQCVILKGVTIGKNSVIAANSVVFNSIPENSIAAGNPCKVIMKRSSS